MEKINISVLGCCVSRDSINFKAEKYNVSRYAAFVSPYSMYNGRSFDISQKIDNASGMTNFIKKMLKQDASKSTVEYIKESSSEWLLFDIADARLPIIRFTQGDIVLTYNNFVRPYIDTMAQTGEYGTARVIKAEELPRDELMGAVNRLLTDIMNIFPADRIILHQFHRSNDYVCKSGHYKEFSSSVVNQNNIWNSLMDELNEVCKNKLMGCHIIPVIPSVMADESNKWGLSPYHYCDIYYEYAEKAISVITKKYVKHIEEEKLFSLSELYTEKFICLRERAKHNLTRVDREHIRDCVHLYQTIINNNFALYDENFKRQLGKVMALRGYKNISIYGYTEVAKLLIKLLSDSDVAINYIVENESRQVPGIKTVNRNPAEYPDCDVMLVADLYNCSAIKAKLEKLNLPFSFFSVPEFIKSLPAANDAVNKTKEQIINLNSRISVERIEKEKIKEKLLEKVKTETELCESIKMLSATNNDLQNQVNEMALKIKAVSYERDKICGERDKLGGELSSLKESTSYKIGRVFTYIPRKIRDAIK